MSRSNRTIYKEISYFDSYMKDLIDRNMTFILQSTTYTRKIRTAKFNILFNSEGQSDYKVLALINRVRSEGKIYMDTKYTPGEGHIKYFDLIDVIDEKDILYKVDIKAAYWSYAMKLGVVSPDTNDMLKKLYKDEPVKRLKKARLKSLGSLATTKRIDQYIAGNLITTLTEIKTELTKPLYLDINRGIDNLMKECIYNIPGCKYYYWDCMFVDKKHGKEVINFFKDLKYDVHVGETRLKYVKVGNAGYVVSLSDNKIYMTKKGNIELLKKVINAEIHETMTKQNFKQIITN